MGDVGKNLWDSIVRTLTPAIIGAALNMFVTLDIPVDPGFVPALEGFIVVLFGAIYYVAIRLLETYVSPKFGWLLGKAKQPEYVGKHVESSEVDS